MEHSESQECGDIDVETGTEEHNRQESSESVGGYTDSAELERKVFAAINDGDRNGLQAIFANEADSTEILQILLTTSYQNHEEFYSHDPDTLTDAHELLGTSVENLNAVQIACMLGDEEMALDILGFVQKVTDEMVARKVLYEFMGRVWGKGNTGLHLAAFLGMSELVKKLLEDGANPNRKNERGYKPVDCADDDVTRKMFTTVSEVLPKNTNSSPKSPLNPSRQQYSVENVLAWPPRHLASTTTFRTTSEEATNSRNEKKTTDGEKRKHGASVQLELESLSRSLPTSTLPILTEQQNGAISSDDLPHPSGRSGILVKAKAKMKNRGRVLFDPGTTVLDICMRGDPVDNDSLPTLRETLGLCEIPEESKVPPVDLTVDINNLSTPHQWLTALHLACTHGNTNIVQLLIGNEVRAMVNVKDKEGWTPFHCAVAEGHIEIIKLLGRCQGRTEDDLSTSAPPGYKANAQWFYPPDGPIDLIAETDDGETLEDVALEEKEKEIKALLEDLNKRFPPKPRTDLHSHVLKSTVEEGSDHDEDDESDVEDVKKSNGKTANKAREGISPKATYCEEPSSPAEKLTLQPAFSMSENEVITNSEEEVYSGSVEEIQARGETDYPVETLLADSQKTESIQRKYSEGDQSEELPQASSADSKSMMQQFSSIPDAEATFTSKSNSPQPTEPSGMEPIDEPPIESIEMESCQVTGNVKPTTDEPVKHPIAPVYHDSGIERVVEVESEEHNSKEHYKEELTSSTPYPAHTSNDTKLECAQTSVLILKPEMQTVGAVSVSENEHEIVEQPTNKPTRPPETEKSPPAVRTHPKSQIPISVSKKSPDKQQMDSSSPLPKENLSSGSENSKPLPSTRNSAVSQKVSFFQSAYSTNNESSKATTGVRTSEVRSIASPPFTTLLEKAPQTKLGPGSSDGHSEVTSDIPATPPPLPTKSSAEIPQLQSVVVNQTVSSTSDEIPLSEDGNLKERGSREFDDDSLSNRFGSEGREFRTKLSPKTNRSNQQARESVTRSNRPSVTTNYSGGNRKGDSPSKPVTPTRGTMSIAVPQSSSPLPASLPIALAEKPGGVSPSVSPQKLNAPTVAKMRDMEQRSSQPSSKNGHQKSSDSSTDASKRRSAWTQRGMGSRTSSKEKLATTSAQNTSGSSEAVNNLFDRDSSHLIEEPANPQNVVHLQSHGFDSHPPPSRPQPPGIFLSRSASVKERVKRCEQNANSGNGAATPMKTLDEMAGDNADKNGAPTAVSNPSTQVPSKTKAAASRTGSKGALMGTPTRGGAATVKKDGIGANRLKRQQAQARFDK